MLNLFFEFERGPLRFSTINGAELWFTGDAGDDRDLVGDEGTACESDHFLCKPGKTCTSVVSASFARLPRRTSAQGRAATRSASARARRRSCAST